MTIHKTTTHEAQTKTEMYSGSAKTEKETSPVYGEIHPSWFSVESSKAQTKTTVRLDVGQNFPIRCIAIEGGGTEYGVKATKKRMLSTLPKDEKFVVICRPYELTVTTPATPDELMCSSWGEGVYGANNHYKLVEITIQKEHESNELTQIIQGVRDYKNNYNPLPDHFAEFLQAMEVLREKMASGNLEYLEFKSFESAYKLAKAQNPEHVEILAFKKIAIEYYERKIAIGKKEQLHYTHYESGLSYYKTI
jgi:hypothetical protein